MTERTDLRIDGLRVLALRGPQYHRLWAAGTVADTTGPRAAAALAEIAVQTEDDPVRRLALTAIAGLTDPAAIDTVCELAVAAGDQRLQAVLTGAGHEPSDPARRALWLLLTGRPDRYAELDFDGSLLRAAYRGADVALRRRIAEQARAAGRVEWVRTATGPPLEPPRLDEEQWTTSLRVLVDTRRYDELWRMLPQAPLRWAARIVVELADRGWRPRDGADRDTVESLVRRARGCRTPPSARGLFHDPVVLDGGPLLALSPQGDLLVLPLGRSRSEGFAVRRLEDGEPVSLVPGSYGPPPVVRISGDGALFAFPTPDGGLELRHTYGTAPPRRLLLLPCCRVADFAVISDGTIVVSRPCSGGARVPSVEVWNPFERLYGPMRVVDLSFHGYVCGPERFVVTSDETTLVTSAHGRRPGAIGPDRARVALWRLPSLEPVRTLIDDGPGIDGLTVSTDGRLLLATRTGERKLWRLPSGLPVGPSNRLTPAGVAEGHMHGVSPDGTLLATGLHSSGVALRSLPDGAPLGELAGPDAEYAGQPLWPPEQLRFTTAGALVAGHRHKIMVWRPRRALAGGVPVGAVTLPEVHALRAALAGCAPSDRAWLDLLEILVHLRHRHDIAVSAGSPAGPGATDVEVGG